jgi:tRNA A-37 threonylcarbamoyl transferase component Bud32
MNAISGNIERRISKGSIVQFLYGDERYYCSMENRLSGNHDYFELLKDILPDTWQCKKNTIWYFVFPIYNRMPEYGFKIHISLVSEITPLFLPEIVKTFLQRNVPFKFLVDTGIHDFHNSQSCSRASCGKFVTAYPTDITSFKSTLEDIYNVTSEAYGPFILSDKPYKDSRCIFYRYGAFKGNKNRDVLGEIGAVVINEKTGETDKRLPYFYLPDGVVDPFISEEIESESPLFNNRFEITGCLSSHSSKGGVYEATDTLTGKAVIVKEARPYVNQSQKGKQDAVIGLKHEEKILRVLEKTGVTPKVIDAFYEWQHYFLVLEKIDGKSLAYVERKYLFEIQHGDIFAVQKYCAWYLKILENIVKAVDAIHKSQVVIGDIAPQNILLNSDSLGIKLIDFEGAYDAKNGEFYAPITSLGFSQHKGYPSESDDWHALANVAFHILHPVCIYFTLNPKQQDRLWRELLQHYALPSYFVELPTKIAGGAYNALTYIGDVQSKRIYVDFEKNKDKHDVDILDIIDRIRKYIEYFVENPLPETIFPLDYRAQNTNVLGVSYGRMGILYFLHKSAVDFGKEVETEVKKLSIKLLDVDALSHLPAGLYQGLAGIAWVLLDIGLIEKAERVLQMTFEQQTIADAHDLFYGAAGWGLASLYFYTKIGNSLYLDRALEASSIIENQLIISESIEIYQNIDGHSYSGLMHGNAGLALFYLRLYQSTANNKYLDIGNKLLKAEIDRSETVSGYIAWRKDYSEITTYPYLRFGSSGIGQVILRYYRELRQPWLLQLAETIANSLKNTFSLYPNQFIGMAGIGGYYLDIYKDTGKQEYLEEAQKIAKRILVYSIEEKAGLAFPGDELARISCDLATGSSGIGLFLRKLQYKGKQNELFVDFM